MAGTEYKTGGFNLSRITDISVTNNIHILLPMHFCYFFCTYWESMNKNVVLWYKLFEHYFKHEGSYVYIVESENLKSWKILGYTDEST